LRESRHGIRADEVERLEAKTRGSLDVLDSIVDKECLAWFYTEPR
jgi:hypothetical protein